MPEYPLVTIITPAYNYADLLSETIDSILAQDYSNIEYIVLDDGSTDNTREVLSRYNGRIIWETHNNMGEPATVNKGFQMGKGEYFIVVNSDDPVLPGLVRQSVEFMESHPDVLVGYPRWNEIDENGNIIREYPTYDYHFVNLVKWFHCLPGPGVIIRRKVVELVGGRDVSFRWISDMDMWLRIGLVGKSARIPYVLATYRTHPRARTQADKSFVMAKEYVRIAKDFFSREDIPMEIEAVKNQMFSHVYYLAGTFTMQADWALARQYFLQSMWYCPIGLESAPGTKRRSWLLMLRVIFLPRIANRWLKQIRMIVKRKSPQ